VNELGQRIITAIIFGVIVLGAVWFGAFTFSLLLVVMAIIGLWEFAQLSNKLTGVEVSPLLLTMSGTAVLLMAQAVLLGYLEPFYLMVLVPLPFILLIAGLYVRYSQPLKSSAILLLGIFYVVVPLITWLASAMIFSGESNTEFSAAFIFAYLAILWSNDSGAYLAGRSFGRNKLFERISPKKTWEGFAGGITLAVIAGMIASHFIDGLSSAGWVLVSVVLSITATLGDLVESMFKRNAGVKDSGSLMPGHGGVLDRFDGLFISAPFIFVLLLIFGN
jgi:phosphatidate cytidylyltransferase